MKILKKLVFIFIVFYLSFSYTATCSLTEKDVSSKITSILKLHASYKELNTDLIEKALRNFLEELDPTKSYFLESDIAKWLYPSNELKIKILSSIKKNKFSCFEDIYEVMISTIARRNLLEKKVSQRTIPQDVDFQEIKDSSWPLSEEDLLERLIKIKSLWIKTAKQFQTESEEKFLQMIEKRRLLKEEKFLKNKKKPNTLIFSYILKAIASSLDAHTNYFTPQEAAQFLMDVHKRFFGIGAVLKDNLNGFSIEKVLENSPSYKNGKLQIRDLIVAVDQKPIIGMDIMEVVEMIRGKEGSKVLLTILRNGEKLEVEVTRGEVVLENTRLKTTVIPYGNGIIGYLQLFSFYEDPKSSSSKDMEIELEKLKEKENLKGVILDLRNNSGGLLSEAVKVTSLFITKGIVVSIKDNEGKIKHLRDIEGKITWEGALVVLTNKCSASASEIVSQTLQDYKRAIIVGDKKTFGKGSFQTFSMESSDDNKINPQGEFKVTRGKYYSVSGKSPQLYGVTPDIVVPGIFFKEDLGEEFAKFPLNNDKISPHFKDDLSDLPYLNRRKFSFFYNHDLQPILKKYFCHLDALKDNSKKRIENDENYQDFLKTLNEKNYNLYKLDFFNRADLQKQETIQIMKDLIFFMEKKDQQLIAN
ncbi:MAG: hypothetical protein AMS24_04025 [Chlamydiae bacterium SM23_39]|nr:MAG: hypothetical protein AMS24_04025 [Chlamydiae bacterium SM23_39]